MREFLFRLLDKSCKRRIVEPANHFFAVIRALQVLSSVTSALKQCWHLILSLIWRSTNPDIYTTTFDIYFDSITSFLMASLKLLVSSSSWSFYSTYGAIAIQFSFVRLFSFRISFDRSASAFVYRDCLFKLINACSIP